MGRRVVIGVLAVVILLGVSCGGGGGLESPIPPAAITGDNSGGAIALYQTQHMSDDHSHVEFYAQKISPEEDFLWGEKGILIASGDAAFYWTCDLYAVSDGSGGAIIAYEYFIPCGDGTQGNCDSDIYAQRIEAEGNVLWGTDGVPVCVEPSLQHSPGIVDDGAGGAIVFFVTHFFIGDYPYPAIHALRIDADGHKLWPEDVQVWEGAYVSVISDGSGGGISLWYGDEESEARAQRLDAAGRELWGPDGTALTLRDLHSPLAVPDGCGGVFISWSAVKFKGEEVSQVSFYVQKVDAGGNVMWGDDGILLNP